MEEERVKALYELFHIVNKYHNSSHDSVKFLISLSKVLSRYPYTNDVNLSSRFKRGRRDKTLKILEDPDLLKALSNLVKIPTEDHGIKYLNAKIQENLEVELNYQLNNPSYN